MENYKGASYIVVAVSQTDGRPYYVSDKKPEWSSSTKFRDRMSTSMTDAIVFPIREAAEASVRVLEGSGEFAYVGIIESGTDEPELGETKASNNTKYTANSKYTAYTEKTDIDDFF